MSWEDQGRQYHMWFGSGTAPTKNTPPAAKSDPMFGNGAAGLRIDAIARSALANMPRKDRSRAAVSFDRQRLEQLRAAMTAWIGARSLSDAAFAERLVDGAASGATVEKLRAAAEGVRTAETHQDLGDASAELAGAMLGIGLDRWPGFLRDAAERADAYRPAQGTVVLALAVKPNTATDASPGGTPAPVPVLGRYVSDDPGQWIGQPSIGDGECVTLVRKATGAPLAKTWQPGLRVQGNTAIQPGAAIATFDKNGHYVGHAAIYLGQNAGGIQVIDQWNNYGKNGVIITKQNPHERTIRFGGSETNVANQGERYNVVR